MTSGPEAKRPFGDTATVSVQVGVAPEDAFEVFTQEIDLSWWAGLLTSLREHVAVSAGKP